MTFEDWRKISTKFDDLCGEIIEVRETLRVFIEDPEMRRQIATDIVKLVLKLLTEIREDRINENTVLMLRAYIETVLDLDMCFDIVPEEEE